MVFEGLSFDEKNKNLIKNSGQALRKVQYLESSLFELSTPPSMIS